MYGVWTWRDGRTVLIMGKLTKEQANKLLNQLERLYPDPDIFVSEDDES